MRSIGWKEKIDFPELGLKKVPAKVDTGARTSVLHCSHIELIRKRRKSYVKFIPLDPSLKMFKDKEFIFPFHKERTIKNSFGQEENRYVINTVVKMFRKEYPIEISLRDRSNMEFPVLLGRSFVRHTFMVDVSKSNLSARYHKKSKKSATSQAQHEDSGSIQE